uniref:Uncharacterized protein n=1 Tax=Candidatus Kentrum sp. SD TaxID=2126332 RepID=A0A450YT39_9GAMM|nr:MAG: hypothetical protein BECKSD772F_GA0070984_104220 [Candidatus Kentron sp. SD]VFK44700.1 MAG: hypothetical protein BECKSD772E_GA0070983_104221 [Candidatus Kentron sp. SD]
MHTQEPTPESVWAFMQETARQMKETDRQMKETDRRMKETDQKIEETDRIVQETAHQMKETDRRLKRAEALFTSQWGRLDVSEKQKFRGIEQTRKPTL